ncbi:hypothetical protein FKM82_025961 [Ascaphus truei]
MTQGRTSPRDSRSRPAGRNVVAEVVVIHFRSLLTEVSACGRFGPGNEIEQQEEEKRIKANENIGIFYSCMQVHLAFLTKAPKNIGDLPVWTILVHLCSRTVDGHQHLTSFKSWLINSIEIPH